VYCRLVAVNVTGVPRIDLGGGVLRVTKGTTGAAAGSSDGVPRERETVRRVHGNKTSSSKVQQCQPCPLEQWQPDRGVVIMRGWLVMSNREHKGISGAG
jgi:hypothetical protein